MTESRETGRRVAERRAGTSRALCLVLVLVGAVVAGVAALVWVPWGSLSGVHPVTERDYFSASVLRAARSYSDTMLRLGWAETAVSLVVAWLLALTPWGRGLVRPRRGPWWVRVLVGSLLLPLVSTVLTLPLVWLERRESLRTGLTHQSALGWWQDQGLSLLVSWVVTALVLLVLVGLARRSPRRWPLWAGVLLAVLTMLGSFVWPVLVEPLFNQFTPLAAGPLRGEILRLAGREHVRVSDVLVTDASRRTTTLNAYVSGFGSTRRVVVYDTLLDGPTRREVLSVVAHELAHARHQDELTGTVMWMGGTLAGVGLLGLVLSSARLRHPGGSAGMGDPAVLPLVLALMALGSLLTAPLANGVSREIEARADRDALVATRDPGAMVRLQVDLARRSLADPTPPALQQWWFGSHPTPVQRIAIARSYE